MKPRPFAYFAPTTLDEALALLAKYGDRARPLAGGQSLVQRMNMREVSPEVIVDLNRIGTLDWQRTEDGGALRVGAMTRQQRLATDGGIRAVNPALTEAASLVAFPTVRQYGTLGGSVANAEPGAQLPLLLTALDARATIAREGGQRSSPIADLFAGARALTLSPDELLVDIAIPPLAPGAGHAMREFRRGHAGPPAVTVVAIIELDGDGNVSAARLGVSGATQAPLRLREEEDWLTGRPASPETFARVAEQAATHADRGDPVVADVAFRRRLTRGLLTRALAASAAVAHERAAQQTTTHAKERQ